MDTPTWTIGPMLLAIVVLQWSVTLFLVCVKALDQLAWAWGAVLAPLWAPSVLAALFVIAALVADLLDARATR